MKKREELYRAVSLRPFDFLVPSISVQSRFVAAALCLQVAMLFFAGGFRSLFVVASTLLAAFLAEAADIYLAGRGDAKNPFPWIMAFVAGCATGLLLPSSFPPATAFFVSFVVFLADRRIMGGFAASWLNPVALSVSICCLVGFDFFPKFPLSVEDLQSRNPALSLIQGGSVPILPVDARITGFLNDKIFSLLGISVPDGYVSFFWDNASPIPAFRFGFLTLVTSLVLFSFGVYSFLVPAVFLFVYSLLVRFALPLFFGGPLFQGDVILAVLSSGTLFGTLFLLQWHGTVPMMRRGRLIYAVLAGVVAFFEVGVGASPSGFVFTVLIMNVASPLIQTVENYLEHRSVASVGLVGGDF